MSFLRPGALWLLPLILVPLLIHLAHRRRQPTMQWPAMMFLHRAVPSKRGPARLKRWLVLATRMAVVAAVVFALARPLSSGLFGVAAGHVSDRSVTVILLDRSPSMQRRLSGGETRQDAALTHLAATLKTLSVERVIVIDSVSEKPIELASPDSLMEDRFRAPADSTADLVGMMEEACVYLAGRNQSLAEVWVCSDLQSLDWQPGSDRWQTVRDALAGLGDATRFYLCRFLPDDSVNASVEVTRMLPRSSVPKSEPDGEQGRGLGRGGVSVSLQVRTEDQGQAGVPVSVAVGEISETVSVDVQNGEGETSGVPLPQIAGGAVYGSVTIPPDINAADDRHYFAADTTPRLRLALVTRRACDSLEVAAELFGRIAYSDTARTVTGSRLTDVEFDWNALDGLLWQGAMPVGEDAKILREYIVAGGTVLFFAPGGDAAGTPSSVDGFAGVRWGSADGGTDATSRFDDWEFPVGNGRPVLGELVRRAGLPAVQDEADETERTLIGQVRLGSGTAWFCGADVADASSPFVADGLVLYAMMAEALNQTAVVDSLMRQADAGSEEAVNFAAGATDSLTVLSGESVSLWAAEWGHHAGVFQFNDSESAAGPVLAINPPAAEFDSATLTQRQLSELVPGLNWTEVELGNGNPESGFVREIWTLVWTTLIVGMLLEGWFSLPPRLRGTR